MARRVEQDRFLGAGGGRLGASEDVREIVQRFHAGRHLVEALLADRRGDDREALLVELLGVKLDAVGDDEDRGAVLALAHVEAEVADAARDDEADVGVLEAVEADGLDDRLLDLLDRHRELQQDRVRRLIEALEMVVETEDAAVVDADAFEDSRRRRERRGRKPRPSRRPCRRTCRRCKSSCSRRFAAPDVKGYQIIPAAAFIYARTRWRRIRSASRRVRHE